MPTKPIVSSDCAHPDNAPPKSASVEGNDSSRFCSFAPPDFAIVKGNDSYGIFNIAMLNEFIRKATVHSSQCHAPLGLLSVKKHMGAAIVESWRCPSCQCVLELRNCEWTTTGVVEIGRKHARAQPALYVKIAAGLASNGISLAKGQGFLSGSLGIRMVNYQNGRRLNQKVCPGIYEIYLQRKEENLKKHVLLCKELPNYQPVHYKRNGVDCTATPGPISIDGVGMQRAYCHCIKGTETATIV